MRRLAAPYTIRAMTSADLPALLALQVMAFTHPWSAELVRRELAHEWSTIYLAEEPAAAGPALLVGFIIFWLVHDELHVLNIATAPLHRRRGVARELLSAALARGREHRCRLATLEVRKGNEAALGLYRSFGFRSVGVRPNYYSEDREDAVVMLLDVQN